MPDSEEAKDVDSKTAEKGKSFLELALGGTVILTATSGILFLVGWAYLEEYYGRFGLNCWILDFPAYTPLLYSVASIPRWFIFCIFLAYMLFFGTLVARQASKIKILKSSTSPRR